MDFKQIEEEERKLEQKQSEFLGLAKQICVVKNKTNSLDIENVAKERALLEIKQNVIEKQVDLEVLKRQVAYLEETYKGKAEQQKKIVEETQDGKRRLWGNYKAFSELADKEEEKLRKHIRDYATTGKSVVQNNEKSPSSVLSAEIEVMREFLKFQEKKMEELMKIIAQYEGGGEMCEQTGDEKVADQM